MANPVSVLTTELPVSIYFMPEWWDRHFHVASPRPHTISQCGLEDVYLKRLRFLAEHFGDFCIGQEDPSLGSGQISTVIRYGFDLIPALLGTKLGFAPGVWGFYPEFRALDQVRDLRPVDIASHPEGEWIVAEKARLDSLYGDCTHIIDMGSVSNNAFRIIGEELYLGLAGEPELIRDLFEAIAITEKHLFDFLNRVFPPVDVVPISNCNVHFMGPRLYEEIVLPFDARQNRFAQTSPADIPKAALHHCDVQVDAFISAYSKLPGLATLQASLESDIASVKSGIPGCHFSALVNPAMLMGDLSAFRSNLHLALGSGAGDLALWNIDSATDLQTLRSVLSAITDACSEYGYSAQFSALPLCWEELEWAHGAYQQVLC